ncbi:MAG: type II secretion system protein [Magnetococcales bacterium]|nr:type II secretion system protein [Magnetococcales bacterium]
MDDRRSGMTLVEIAVVMVIMGLLVGTGILMGRAMIEGARAKDTMAMASDLVVAVRGFKEKYHYLPGDLPNARAKISTDVPVECDYTRDDDANTPMVVGNGVIDAVVVGVDKLSETSCVSEHLSHAGMIKGGAEAMRSRFGVVRVLSRAAFELETGAPDLPDTWRNVIVFEQLPLDVAQEMDRQMDEGGFNSGQHRYVAQDPVPLYVLPL